MNYMIPKKMMKKFIEQSVVPAFLGEDKVLKEVVEKASTDLSKKIDHFMFACLKQQAPFAYRILTKRCFQKPWMTKLLKLELRQYPRDMDNSIRMDVLIRGRVIGRSKMSQLDLIKS